MTGAPRVIVVGDDLIWRQRLVDALARVPAEARVARDRATAIAEAATSDAAIVDLSAVRIDPFDVIAALRGADIPVLAVGPHDDQPLRRRARDAGADRVLAYRKLFEDGPATLASWLERVRPVRGGT